MLYPANLFVAAFVLLLVAVWLCFLWWALRSGQLRDVEAVKYKVLEPDPEEEARNHA
ncbi:MAG: hypothetical protein HY689_10070 [Chloroflexi bacterium]|nr:hypothetical protein [Chloroflexota bacterium]